MPKKFKGENSKAVVARARKAAIQHEKEEKLKAAAEDEYWRDDDKHLQKKQQRKDDTEKKRQEQLEKKKEREELLAAEMDSLKSAKPAPTAKVTRAEIEVNKQKIAAEEAAARVDRQESNISVDEMPLEENINRMVVDGDEARGIDEAISVLSVKEAKVDKHPEKRVKAAYQEFEDRNLPILKKENPNLRLSQLKQMLKKDWMKSPENPLNQRLLARNS